MGKGGISISGTQLGQVFTLFILLLLSGFFSGSETALFSLSRIRIRNLMDKGVPQASLIFKLINEPSRLLSTLLIGNNLVNIVTSSIATVFFISLFGPTYGVSLAVLITTVFVLIFGEIVPKTYANHFPEKWSFKVIGPIRALMSILSPAITLLTTVTNFVMRLTGKPHARTSLVTEDELRTIINLGQKEGIIQAEERSMLTSVLEFTDTTVRETMVPRVDVYGLNIDTSVRDAGHAVVAHKFSRIPVFDRSIDNIVGIVHVKDLVGSLLTEPTPTLRSITRPTMFVPEGLQISKLLPMMQQERVSMVIVLDEYGATSGLVTIEDIVEEIFGDITDEYDECNTPIQVIDDEVMLVDGSYPIDELSKDLGIDLPKESVETIGGFLFLQIGDIPQVGERVSFRGWEFSIEEMEGRRVSKVKICRETETKN